MKKLLLFMVSCAIISLACGQTVIPEITQLTPPLTTPTAQLTRSKPLPIANTPAPSGEWVTVTADKLYVRPSVGMAGYPVDVLTYGDKVLIMACVPDTIWAVTADGFINSRFLSVKCPTQ
jgi:hypothetical protein